MTRRVMVLAVAAVALTGCDFFRGVAPVPCEWHAYTFPIVNAATGDTLTTTTMRLCEAPRK